MGTRILRNGFRGTFSKISEGFFLNGKDTLFAAFAIESAFLNNEVKRLAPKGFVFDFDRLMSVNLVRNFCAFRANFKCR
jgi:hypothetical protein